jgi:membrane protein YqaA with SNARE-associated domain
MSEIAENTDKEAEKSGQSFGLVHVLALLAALAVTIGIPVFLPPDFVERFEGLVYLGAFLAMLISSATVILPVPGIILVFTFGARFNPLLVGLAAGPGAALGEMTGYLAGYGASAIVDNTAMYERISRWVGGRYGLAVIALLAFIPNPVFDMAGMVAGSLRIKWWQFLVAATIGKTARSILIAYGGAYGMDWVEQLFL